MENKNSVIEAFTIY